MCDIYIKKNPKLLIENENQKRIKLSQAEAWIEQYLQKK